MTDTCALNAAHISNSTNALNPSLRFVLDLLYNLLIQLKQVDKISIDIASFLLPSLRNNRKTCGLRKPAVATMRYDRIYVRSEND